MFGNIMNSDHPERDYELLLSAHEESGLYELVWTLTGHRNDIRIGEAYRIADELIRFHLGCGNIQLVRRFVDQSHDDESIAESDCDDILKKATSWYPSELSGKSSQVCFVITDKGQLAFAAIKRNHAEQAAGPYGSPEAGSPSGQP